MVLDASLLNTQQYKVRIKGKVEQSKERSSALPLHLGVVSYRKREPSGHPRLWSPTLLYLYKVYSKSIDIEDVFIKKKWAINKTIIFFKISTLVFNILVPASIPLVKAPINLHHHISFNVYYFLKSFLPCWLG